MIELLIRRRGMPKSTPIDYSTLYFTIESLQDGNVVSIKNNNCATCPTFYYSTDGGETWGNITAVKSQTVTVTTINTGDKLIFKCSSSALATGWDTYNCFACSKNYNVYGNAMSLLYGDNFASNSEFSSTSTHNFAALFRNDTHVIDAGNLILPALIIKESSYNGMFRSCTGLTTAPILPGTTLAVGCYSSMFEGCINLLEGPELPATVSAQECYQRMFCMNRNAKITTPKMTKSPVIRVNGAGSNCFKEMFKGNGNLVEITCLATTTSGASNWLQYGSSTGTFKKPSTVTWARSVSGIPSGWTIENYVE